jgi:hypothetical protein
MAMVKFGATANPGQIAAMARVLDAYCNHAGITSDAEREAIGAQIVALFELGLKREDELMAALILPAVKSTPGR